MTATFRLIGLMVPAIPIFFGLTPFAAAAVLPGVSWGAVFYAFVSMAAVALFCGRAFLASTLAVTALIVAPVVFAGGLISWLLAVGGGAPPGTAGSLRSGLQ